MHMQSTLECMHGSASRCGEVQRSTTSYDERRGTTSTEEPGMIARRQAIKRTLATHRRARPRPTPWIFPHTARSDCRRDHDLLRPSSPPGPAAASRWREKTHRQVHGVGRRYHALLATCSRTKAHCLAMDRDELLARMAILAAHPPALAIAPGAMACAPCASAPSQGAVARHRRGDAHGPGAVPRGMA